MVIHEIFHGWRLIPVAPPDSHQVAVTLARHVSEGADAVRVADHVVAVWQRTDDALAPIIGSQGVAALYRRSLHLAAPAHPWLAGLREADTTPVDASALRSALVQQEPAAAAAGAGALLQAFHELLASLVGPSLTRRLLAAAWDLPASGSSAQGTSP